MADRTSHEPPLDDVLLAMDVVDTIRHREQWVARQLDEAGREAELKSRLRAIYAGQGIQVSDEVLSEGIRALNEDRFKYEPLAPGLSRSLALLWVRRWHYARIAAFWCLAVMAMVGAYYAIWIRPLNQRSAALTEAFETAVQNAGQAGRERAGRLLAVGQQALEQEDLKASDSAAGDLRRLGEELSREYTLRIVSTRWEQKPGSLHERLYYLVVEAVTRDGGVLRMPIGTTGAETKTVDRWAIEVARDVFVPVDQDLRDDGKIQDNRLGVKELGKPDVDYLKPVLGNISTDVR